MLRKLPIVAVLGQGTPIAPERRELARSVGALVARLGAHLLTGAGFGVMAAAAEGFVGTEGRPGFSIGVVPRYPGGPLERPNQDADGRPYPNPFVEIPIYSVLPPRVDDWHNQPARNHVNILSADGIIALPGNVGTRNELEMAMAYRGEMDRPRGERRTVLIGPPDEFDADQKERFVLAATVADAEHHLRGALAARGFSI
jgi:uncharacterized protein (TIGR00725 family)